MEIKLVTHKELNKLRKLKVNKNFKQNFQLLKMSYLNKEITFVMIDSKHEILGAFSYSKDTTMHTVTIDEKKYKITKPIRRLEFIEVKPTATRRGIAQQLLHYAFEIFAETNCGVMISNICMDGEHLIPLYKELSNKHKVDLLFSLKDEKYGEQIFNVEEVIPTKPSFFKRIFKF